MGLRHENAGDDALPLRAVGQGLATALSFFAELGFDTLWQHDGLAGLRFGGAYFMLQDIDVPEWQGNQMITFEVDDLDAYWSEIEPKNLPGRFAGVRRGRRDRLCLGPARSTSSIRAVFAGTYGSTSRVGRAGRRASPRRPRRDGRWAMKVGGHGRRHSILPRLVAGRREAVSALAAQVDPNAADRWGNTRSSWPRSMVIWRSSRCWFAAAPASISSAGI